MKLANIYAVDSAGTRRGQAAAGSTDAGCIDVKAVDDGGIQRDIKKVVVTDGAGAVKFTSKRLVDSTVADYKYISKTWATGPQTREFNNAFLSGGTTYYLYCQYQGTILIDSSVAFPNYEEWICLSWNSAAIHWGVGVTSDGWLFFESAYGGNKSIGYGAKIPFDTPVYIDVRSDTALGGANNLVNYKINNAGSWGYFTSGKGSGSAVSFPKFTEYSTYLQFGRVAPLWLIGEQKVTGNLDGTTFKISNFSVEGLPVGTGSFADQQGRTFTGASIFQHYTTTKVWEE